MALTGLRKLSVEHYNKAFLLYDKLGDRFETMTRWTQSLFVLKILPNFNVNIAEGQQLRHLGIGSGAGDKECHLLKQLLPKYPHIDNHVVEPSTELIAKYKSYVSTNDQELEGINFNWYQLRLEDYSQKREKDGDTSKFHLISAVHSMYYPSGDLDQWLDYLYGLLDEGGMLMVILIADTSAFGNIRREFPEIGAQVKFSNLDSGPIRQHFEKKAGMVSYHDYVRDRIATPTDCFPEIPSVESDLIIDFVAHCEDFRKTCGEPLRERFLKFLGSDRCIEVADDGRRRLNADWGVTVAHRQPNNL